MPRFVLLGAVVAALLPGCRPAPDAPPQPAAKEADPTPLARPLPVPLPVPVPEPTPPTPTVVDPPVEVAVAPHPRPVVPVRVVRKPNQPLRPPAPPLPAPTGPVVVVDTAAKLYDAVARIRPGGTILLADGTYAISAPLRIQTDRVALRSRSGDRDRVVLDGGGSLGEVIWVTGCSDVTVADLTVRDVRFNGIKVNSDSGVQRLSIYNCVFRNVWQRGVKGVTVPEANRDRLRPRDCRIEHCLFVNDRPKKYGDDPADTADTYGGDYIAGIDVMFASGWVIRDNVFRGIRGRTGQGRGAVFLWMDSRDCVVERNVVVDCDAGINLGNAHRDPKVPVHCTGCVVRNNCVTRAPEGGVSAVYTRDCKILHNTVCDPAGRIERGIRVVHPADGLVVANNLLAGPKVIVETVYRIDDRNNVEGVSAAVFADAAAGDLHLAERADGVVDAGKLLPDAATDLDGNPRGRRADLGAHEFGPE